MKPIVCTIITTRFADRAIVLAESLRRTGYDCHFIAFVTGSLTASDKPVVAAHGVEFRDLSSVVCDSDIAAQLRDKYQADADRIRWTFKPLVLLHALGALGASCALYVDPDMFFVGSPDAVFEPLRGGASIVLTPHWRPLDPEGLTKEFRLSFMDGLYNAGCVAAARGGVAALHWWARACLAGCEKDYASGFFDDQRYLDLMPICFEDVHLCRNQGVNVADWNSHLRQPNASGVRRVPDVWPIGLIHFTRNTVVRIRNGHDEILAPYLATYEESLYQARARLRGAGCT
jgi:hypothetical protein